jgi:hypothetical protein
MNNVILFRGDVKPVMVQSGIYPRRTLDRQVTWEIVDKKCSIRVDFSDEGLPLDPISTHARIIMDPLIGYRTALLVDALPELHDESVEKAIGLISGIFGKEYGLLDPNSQFAELVTVFKTAIGLDIFTRICAALPEIDTVLPALRQAGGTYATGSLQHMVEAGKLEPTAYMKSVGIDKPEVLEARRVRLADQALKFVPFHREYLRDQQHVCNLCEQSMSLITIQCLERGLTEFHEIAAFSIASMAIQTEELKASLTHDTRSRSGFSAGCSLCSWQNRPETRSCHRGPTAHLVCMG